MSTKRDRQAVILELIETEPVASQEELRRLVRQRGWDVTQSTLSRDVHELRLVRVPSDEGMHYARTEAGGVAGAVAGVGRVHAENGQPSLEDLVPQLVTSVDGVSELLVLRTPPGSAHTVAVALDRERGPGVVGTIAGDDTILVVCRSPMARDRLARRLTALLR
jgi:transcriptional regulator of arginine metabolism